MHILKWQLSYVFFLCVKSNKFSGDSLGSVGGRKQSSSPTFTSPYPISLPPALQPLHWELALQFAAVTLSIAPALRVVADLCPSHPTFHLLSQIPLFPCLENILGLNSTINQSLEYPVPQYKIKIQFWVDKMHSSGFIFIFFLLPRNSFMLMCVSFTHTSLTWCRTELSFLYLPKFTLASLADVAVVFVEVKFVRLDNRAVLLSAATVRESRPC